MKKLIVLVFFAAITMISFAWVVVLKFPHRDGGTSNRDGGTSMVSGYGNVAGVFHHLERD